MIDTNADRAKILSNPQRWIKVVRYTMPRPLQPRFPLTESAPVFLCQQCGFDTVPDLELLQNVGHVMFDGFFAEE